MKYNTTISRTIAILFAITAVVNALSFEEFVDSFSMETYKRERGEPVLHESHHQLMSSKGNAYPHKLIVINHIAFN